MSSLRDLQRRLAKLEAQGGKTAPDLEGFRRDPANLMSGGGLQADPWQARVLRSTAGRMLLCCSRQSGKSTVGAALALRAALLEAPALVLLVARAERQANELFRKLVGLYHALGRPVARANAMSSELHLVNGSRVIPLPGREESIRSFSAVRLLVLDEAARVPDDLYVSVRPMLAVSRGRLVALSSPFGKRGWFWEAWESKESWERVKITAEQCPRISREFLEEERRAIGPRWWAQEYGCSFEDVVGTLFPADLIASAFSDDVAPLFPLR